MSGASPSSSAVRAWVAALFVAACGSGSGPRAPSEAADAATARSAPATPPGRFVRVPPKLHDRAHRVGRPRGEVVGNLEILGAFVCKLEERFGPPDPYVALNDDEPPVLGFALKHVASGLIIVPYLGRSDWGYAGAFVGDAGGPEDDRHAWQPMFLLAAAELEAVVAATAPSDCEHTYSGGYRVNRAGVRGGSPFFEHVALPATLDVRLAQFAENDGREDPEPRARIQRELCHLARQNWREARRDRLLSAYERREELRARLVRCVEDEVARETPSIEAGGFDADAAPPALDDLLAAARDLELADRELERRIERLRAIVRGHARRD